MDHTSSVLIRLQDLSQFLTSGTLEHTLQQQASMTASLLEAESCSIMLIDDGEGEQLRMSMSAHHGTLPPAAWQASIGKGDGIAGQVLASGRPLLVADIHDSPFAHLARRADDPRRSLMLAPIGIDGKTVGIVSVCAHQSAAPFRDVDLHLLGVIALMIGKSVQVMQLQAILNSRFTQLALMQEVQGRMGSAIASTAYQNPDQIARILAKSLFKEMTKAGFGSAQIIGAASEIIALLGNNLQRHSRRAARHDQDAKQ
jgi:L-methionine (R)-S-oxide reductase